MHNGTVYWAEGQSKAGAGSRPETTTVVAEVGCAPAWSHLCFFCGGVAHPSTGSQLTERVLACGPCVLHFLGWFRGHVNKRFGGYRFYDHVCGPEGTWVKRTS